MGSRRSSRTGTNAIRRCAGQGVGGSIAEVAADEGSGLHEPPVAGIEDRDGAIVVLLAGELDLYNAHEVREQLLAQAGRAPERLVVDLSRVTFIDSTGLG